MALHLIPVTDVDAGAGRDHLPSRDCWCGPDLVAVPVEHCDDLWRQAWQHRGKAVEADAVEVAT